MLRLELSGTYWDESSVPISDFYTPEAMRGIFLLHVRNRVLLVSRSTLLGRFFGLFGCFH
jgi:hypothetical protein